MTRLQVQTSRITPHTEPLDVDIVCLAALSSP
jgi:hypothetical protein